MRILWVSPFPPEKGGVSNYSYKVVNKLAEKGLEIDILSNNGNTPNDLQDNINILGKIPKRLSDWNRIVRLEHDVWCFQYSGISAKNYSLYRFLFTGTPPSVLTLHEPTIGYKYYPFLSLFDSYAFLSEFAKKEFLTNNDTLSKFTSKPIFDLPIHGVNPDLRHDISGIDTSKHINRGNKTIICPGFIVERKQYHLVVKSLKQVNEVYPDTHLLFAGGPHPNSGNSYRDKIQSIAEDKGVIDQISITGYVDSSYFYALLRDSDICVLPYRFIYQSGIILNSILLNTPPIVSPIDSLKSPVSKYGGIVLDEVSESKISEAIVRGLEDVNSVKSSHVANELSWKMTADSYFDVFNNLQNS